MEQRKRVTQPSTSDDGIGEFFGVKQGKNPVTEPSVKTTSKDGIGDFLQKKNVGGNESSNGSTPSNTSESESTSPIPGQKQSSEKSTANPTAFNTAIPSSQEMEDIFYEQRKPKPLYEPTPKPIDSTKFLAEDINKNSPNIFENIAKNTEQVMPFATKMSAFDKERAADAMTKNVFGSPTEMQNYTNQRVKQLRSEISNLENQKLKYVDIDPEQGIKTVTNEDGYSKSNLRIAEKQKYINDLKGSVAEVASEKILSNIDLSSFDPTEIGRKIIEVADPELTQQFKVAERGGTIPNARRGDLQQLGLNAAKAFLKKHPDTPNAKKAYEFIADMESDFDQRFPDVTASRVRTKLGKYFYEQGNAGTFGYSQDELLKAIHDPKSNLSPSEVKNAETVVLPTEKRIWGTDIPGSGFLRGGRGAVEKQVTGTNNTIADVLGLRNESDMAIENLAEPENTRYAPIEGISKWNWIRNGLGDLTGQVAVMALTTKGIGSAGKLISGAATEGGILGGMTRSAIGSALQNENVGLAISSYLASKDSYSKQALQIMPGDENADKREAYSNTMAGVEALSEKIFNDTKILKAFSGELAPAVRDISTRYINNEITSAIAKKEFKSAFMQTIKPFAREFVKSEVQEPTEETVVDLADGAAQSIFGGTPFDIAVTGKKALNTFVTTAMFSPLVSALAAHGAARQSRSENAFMKYSIGQMAADPGTYLTEVDRLEDAREITSAEANEKRKLIKSAAVSLNDMPENKSVLEKDSAGEDEAVEKPFTPTERTSYVLHRLNEQILQDKIDKSTDPVAIQDLKKQLNRSVNIRKGIYDGSVTVNSDLQEVAETPEDAKKLDIINPEIKEPSAPVIEGIPEEISQPVELNPNATKIVNVDEISKPIELNPNGETDFNPPIVDEQHPELANEIPEPDTTPFATVNNDTKEFITKSGKQKVVREDGRLRVVNTEDESEVSPKMQKKALKEYSRAYDYTSGEKASEPNENDVYSDENELKSDMVSKSNSPSELAAIYADEPEENVPISAKEQVIADFGISTTEADYRTYGDRNKKTGGIAMAYFSKKGKGTGLDTQAKEMSDHSGLEITPQDLVDFMDRFPNGTYQAEQKNISSVAQQAADKFFKLTGLHLTPEIAELAIDQEGSKLDFINNQLLKETYESERAFTDAYFESLQNNAPVTPESKSKATTTAREVGKENNATKQPDKASEGTTVEKQSLADKIRSKKSGEKSIKESGKELADKIRKLKSSRGQANANIFGLAVGVYDGLIEAVATAVENGAKLADAIKSAINTLSPEDKAKLDEAGFTESLADLDESESEETASEPVKPKSSIPNNEEPKIDQRRFTGNQVLEDKTILPEVRSQLKKNLDYVVQTNALTIAEAEFITNNFSPDEIYDIVVNNIEPRPAVRVVLGQALIKKYNQLALKATDPTERNKYIGKTVDIANYVSEKLGTESGQMIQAFSLYSKLSPEAQVLSATREAKKDGSRQKDKARRNVADVSEKLKKANSEAIDEVLNSNETKKSTKEASEKKKQRIKTQIEKAQDERKKLTAEYRKKSPPLYASVTLGLTADGIAYTTKLAGTYIKEGVANAALLVENIKTHLSELTGKPITKEAEADILKLANDAFDAAIAKDQRRSERLINEGLKDTDQKIGEIVKKHFTEVEATKRSLVDKLVDDAGLSGQEAADLSAKLQTAFDNIATRKKQKLLEIEKKRFERIQNKLAGAKKVPSKLLQDEIIKYTNLGAFSDADMMDKISDMLGTGALTPEQADKITELANKIQTAPEGSPKREATEDLLNYREKIKGTSWGEIAQSLWYANVLSGYRTHLKNIVDTFFSGLGAFSAAFVKNPRSLPFLMVGGGRGLVKGVFEGINTFRSGRSPIHIQKIEASNVLERTNFFGGMVNIANWAKYVTRLLAAEDVLQFRALSELKAYQLAYSEAQKLGYKNPFSKEVWKVVNEKLFNTKERYDEAVEQSKDEGLTGYKARIRVAELMELSRPVQMREESYGFGAHGTYNEPTVGTLGAITDTFAKTLDIQIGGIRPLRLVVPFTRIITNVVDSKLDYTPLGFIRYARKARGFKSFTENHNIKDKYHVMTDDERHAVLAKASLGIITSAALYALTKIKDKDDEPILEITGEGPQNFSKLAELKLQGWQPYSIKFHGKYYSYALTPLMFNLGMLGAMDDHEKYKTKEDETGLFERLSVMAVQGIKMFADMTWVGSTSTLLGAIANPDAGKAEKEFSNIVGNTLKGFVIPGAYTQSAQLFQKLNAMPQKEVKGILDNLIQDIPIARNTLNDKINALGDPIIRDIDLNISSETKDPIWKYLLDHKGWVAPINKNTLHFRDKNGIEHIADENQYYDFAKKRGQIIKQGISDIMDNGAFVENADGTSEIKPAKELTPKQLNKALRAIATEASKEVRIDMQMEMDE